MQLLALRLALGLACALADLPEAGAAAPKPHFVVPADWVTDQAGQFLVLPLSIDDGLDLEQCKVLTNGDKVLVVVTNQPKEEPETDALRKFRLVVEALKAEAKGDEQLLEKKFVEWLTVEEDDEVRVYVQDAVTSLQHVHTAKHPTQPKTLSVRLAAVQKQTHFMQAPAYPSSVLQLRGTSTPARPLANVVSKVQHALVRQRGSAHAVAGHSEESHVQGAAASPWSPRAEQADLFKESFSVDIPYPVPAEKIFVMRSSPAQLLVIMPLQRQSLGAQGVSLGGVPFSRVPVFNQAGKKLAGPSDRNFPTLANGFVLASGLVALPP